MAALDGKPAEPRCTVKSTTCDLLTLALLPEVGPRAVCALRQRGALADVLGEPRAHADLLGPAAVEQLRSGAARAAAERELLAAGRLGLRVVGLDEPDYPAHLARIYDPPPVLYARGLLAGDEGPRSVAVVGSRAASPQGQALARRLGQELAAAGLTVVSGLARGIDAAAHEGALRAPGRTVAVLGSALDRPYPPEHGPLMEAIVARGGAVVSEYRLGTGPTPATFPRRNRLLAGWGRAVLVVEAAERSGALITARVALDEGREVLAVPGHPAFPGAAGTNALIRDGAALVRHAADVLSELGLEAPPRPAPSAGGDRVLAALSPDAPASVDEIQRHTGQPLELVLARLGQLELEGGVRRLPGALFLRN